MRPPPRRGTGSRLGHPEEALAFTAPAGFVRPRDSRASQTPWSVFQDGSGGSPTSSPQTRGAPRRAVPSDGGGRISRVYIKIYYCIAEYITAYHSKLEYITVDYIIIKLQCIRL